MQDFEFKFLEKKKKNFNPNYFKKLYSKYDLPWFAQGVMVTKVSRKIISKWNSLVLQVKKEEDKNDAVSNSLRFQTTEKKEGPTFTFL